MFNETSFQQNTVGIFGLEHKLAFVVLLFCSGQDSKAVNLQTRT